MRLVWDFDCLHFTQYISISPHGSDCKQTWCKKIYCMDRVSWLKPLIKSIFYLSFWYNTSISSVIPIRSDTLVWDTSLEHSAHYMIPSKSSARNRISTGDLGMEIPFKIGHNTAEWQLKIEYHAGGDIWWQPLLSYGKQCTEFKIGLFIY